MKNILTYAFLMLSLLFVWGCEKDNYPGGKVSPYIAVYDVRNIYTGNDVTLTMDNMFGSNKIAGVVVSDHAEGNLPPGLLVVQDGRRLSQLRGISIPIGDAAASYVPGDSVIIDIEGGVLKRVDGILQLTGIAPTAVTKVASDVAIPLNRVTIAAILANPQKYESTLAVIVKGGFIPLSTPEDILGGDKVLNDAFGNITLHTEMDAAFAGITAPYNANYYGIVFNTTETDTAGRPVPQFRVRKGSDVVVLSSTIEVMPVIITGFMSDVKGGDGNYEYVQMKATKDIDFSVTPYSLVFTNNANASVPTGYPANGWATGRKRTYKINVTSGTVAKGEFFYVGGTGKRINGASSTSMSSSNWVKAYDYVNNGGEDFGDKTNGLFANSGNACGVAVFATTDVTVDTKPVDVIFIHTGGSLYTPGTPPKGYRITNTDWYDVKNPITLEDQPYFVNGTNTIALVYNTSDQGYFNLLGGEYSPSLGKWMKARSQGVLLLTKQSLLEEIEGETATKLLE